MDNNRTWKDKDFKDIRSASDMESFLRFRADCHGHYYHYSSINCLDGILSGSEFWLSPLCDTNDTLENFPDIYQLSFSTGESENLPLWYLYSGIGGRGGRLGLSKSGLKKLMEKAEYSLCEFIGGKPAKPVCVLDKSSVKLHDILYISTKDGDYRLKYNNKQLFMRDFDDEADFVRLVDEYKDRCKPFCKNLIWFYEKETRWLVDLPPDVIAKKEEGHVYRVVAKFPPELYEYFTLTLAPEYDKGTDIYAFLDQREGILKLLKYKVLSEHAGEIKMRFGKRFVIKNPLKKRLIAKDR